MNNNVFIHIGSPKTGTSSLQKYLFYEHSELTSLGKVNPLYPNDEYLNKNLERFFKVLKKNQEILFPRNELNELYEKEIKPCLGSKLIISDEGFTHPISADIYLKAKRLQYFFPNAKILYVIRNQYDFIRSYYYMFPELPYLFSKDKKPLPFDEWLDKSLDNINKSYLLAGKYYEIYQAYAEFFGHDNICILLYEDLKYNFDKFINDLAEFIDIDKNQCKNLMLYSQNINTKDDHKVKHIQRQIPFLKNDFSWCPSAFKRIGKKILFNNTSVDIEISKKDEEKIRNEYRKSNNNLEKIKKLDLNQYNYPI